MDQSRRGTKPYKQVDWRSQLFALRNLPQLFKLIWETSRTMTLLNVLLRLSQSVIPLALLYVGKEIIDEIIRLIDAGSQDMDRLWMLIAIELGLAVFSDLLSRAITLNDILLGDLFSIKSSVEIMKHAAGMDMYQFESADFYDKLARARQQTAGRTALMSQVLDQLQSIITVISLGVGLTAYNPLLLLILFIAVIPAFLGENRFNQRNYSLSRAWTPERRELDYLRYIGASDETAKEVKIFNLSNFITERFRELSFKYYKENRKIAMARASWGTVLSSIGTLAYYGAYVFIALQTVQGIITVGTLTFLTGAFSRMRGQLQGIMNRFSRIAQSALYLQDYFDFLAIRPSIVNKADSLPFPRPLKEGFHFENVSFKYPGGAHYALKNVSFHLKAGEKLALVGENGAGKTTLVKLLARLYDPTEGRILVDGIDLRDIHLDDLRNNVGIIFQDYIRFQMSAGDNIAIGRIEERENQDLIQSAAQKSMAEEVINTLPGGYEQLLGKRFANGVDLSGGQWQKIALGRAYMREAQLLILDEPTSALDARAEHEVFVRFSELIEGKTAVLISHRFSTVRMADCILFLEYGQILEYGSHEELIQLDGRYAELFHLQAQGYL